jgi:hypothetical protein
MYTSRICIQKQRNPCLSDLHDYLQLEESKLAQDRSRIMCLDIFKDPKPFTRREIPVRLLHKELHTAYPQQASPDLSRKGRMFLVEDISKTAIEELGTFFNVDPWFFASYVNQPWRKTSTQDPTNCSLPSRDKTQGFLPLQYHRTVSFQAKDGKLRSLTRDCNQQRKVVILPAMGGEKVGLIQHCCSVLLVSGSEEEWTAIVLVDPPITNDYVPSKRHGLLPPNTESSPLFGGTEDFSGFEGAGVEKEQPNELSNLGMLDEIIHYWTQKPPPMFDASNPDLRSFSYYPLKIVAAEWVNYISVLGMSLREYEVSTSLNGDLVAELDKLNVNLRLLQGWRRRIMSTQAKMRRTIRFMESRADSKKASEDWQSLKEDYEFIQTEVTEHGERLEAMVPLVTSAASLIESRRSLFETANVTRLTILAIVFIPLSYVASIFSMSENFGPGGSLFWVYFVTAVPLAVFIGLIAKPPVRMGRKVLQMSGVDKMLQWVSGNKKT